MPNPEKKPTCPYFEISESGIDTNVINKEGMHMPHRVWAKHSVPRCTAVEVKDNEDFPMIDFNRAVNVCMEGKACKIRNKKEGEVFRVPDRWERIELTVEDGGKITTGQLFLWLTSEIAHISPDDISLVRGKITIRNYERYKNSDPFHAALNALTETYPCIQGVAK